MTNCEGTKPLPAGPEDTNMSGQAVPRESMLDAALRHDDLLRPPEVGIAENTTVPGGRIKRWGSLILSFNKGLLGEEDTIFNSSIGDMPHLTGPSADKYFEPKKWESDKLYERFGIGFFKKWMPTGDRRASKQGKHFLSGSSIEDLKLAELHTRRLEVLHLGGFAAYNAVAGLAATVPAMPDLLTHMYLALNIPTNIYPIFLQRCNRIRLNRVIAKKQASAETS